MRDIFASFAVIVKNGMICATTREDGRIGLPGGKCDDSEDPILTCIREAEEEGWGFHSIGDDPLLYLVQPFDGKLIAWVLFDESAEVEKLTDHKEKHRGIEPILVSFEEIKNSGFGNQLAIELAERIIIKDVKTIR
jgi:8-oxo-dGTP pyrophosphatase MutT (NUDIX family)